MDYSSSNRIHKASAIIHFPEGTVFIPESTIYLPTDCEMRVINELRQKQC